MSLSAATPHALPADWRDLFALTKPRVMSLVVFTALCGMLAAPVLPPLAIGFTAILCIALAAGAAGALNQWYEADLDAKMRRTAGRPLPAGRMDRQSALHFGVGLGAFAVILMDLATNHLAALLLAASILFYVIVYTMWLKPRTPQNIVIGGAAGAFPPLIGWVAATGEVRSLPLLLFAIIFLWTPPHFWALSLLRLCRGERADAAGDRRPGRDAAPDPALQPGNGGRGGRPLVAWPHRRRLWADRSRAQPAVRRAGGAGAGQSGERARGDGAGETALWFLGALSIRSVRGARRRSAAGMMPEEELVRRQRDRARIMAWLLGGFVVLLFLVTMAKVGLNR
jgi:hypothetical protein